ncbi:hypothetical protein B4098_1007 [Heyndrickxia coagulans]|uniref:Uncharacterized protein n=1 Tax=Heyndrickxia coagulans TaxID=1398 RepID=A0A150JY03_HEYCO|nr:hypothetical protein B4098_1007 [Heyndrickxia coagulans]
MPFFRYERGLLNNKKDADHSPNFIKRAKKQKPNVNQNCSTSPKIQKAGNHFPAF